MKRRTWMIRAGVFAPLALFSLGAQQQCGQPPYATCNIEVPAAVLVDDGVAEDASLTLDGDGAVLAAYITGRTQTETQVARLENGQWQYTALPYAQPTPERWDANFNNIVVTPDDQKHLIGAFNALDQFVGGDGYLYHVASLPSETGYEWDDWPDVAAAVPITDDQGFDFGAVAVGDELGRIWVVFISDREGPGAADNLWITHYQPGSGWQAPTQITFSDRMDSFAQINIDKDGRLNLAWVRTTGDRSSFLTGLDANEDPVEMEIMTMTSAVTDSSFTGAEWSAETQRIARNPNTVDTLATVLEGPLATYVAWAHVDYSSGAELGLTLTASLTDGKLSEIPVSKQLNRAVRLPDDRYLHAWTEGMGSGHTTIRYEIQDCTP